MLAAPGANWRVSAPLTAPCGTATFGLALVIVTPSGLVINCGTVTSTVLVSTPSMVSILAEACARLVAAALMGGRIYWILALSKTPTTESSIARA